jgi:hypothetical protein
LAELEKFDDQTARADAYSNFKAVLVRYQVPRSWVIGATSDTSAAEAVPSAEFKAQVALVKAAKNVIRDTTAEAQSALQRANDEVTEVRAMRPGDDHGKRPLVEGSNSKVTGVVGDGDRCLHSARPAGLVATHRPAELVVSGLPGLELAGHAQLVNASHHFHRLPVPFCSVNAFTVRSVIATDLTVKVTVTWPLRLTALAGRRVW